MFMISGPSGNVHDRATQECAALVICSVCTSFHNRLRCSFFTECYLVKGFLSPPSPGKGNNEPLCFLWLLNISESILRLVTFRSALLDMWEQLDTMGWPRTFVPSTREPTSSTVRANIIEKRVRDAIIFRHPSQARVKKKI